MRVMTIDWLAIVISVCVFCSVTAQWTIDLEYSFNDFTNSYPLGSIELRRSFDGNYTGTFKSTSGKQFGEKVLTSFDSTYSVRGKSSTQPGQVFISSNSPCLIAQSRLFHLFWLSIDSDRQWLSQISVFPDAVAVSQDGVGLLGESACSSDKELQPPLKSRQGDGTAKGVVHVNSRTTLPSPDTQSFVKKIENERRSRQHGAEADNRSFIAKYWMYIVPVVVVMVLSNAIAPPEGEGAQ